MALNDSWSRVTAAFDGYVGNRGVIQPLLRDLRDALELRPIRLAQNYLLSGPSGCGKGTLAHRISDVLGIPFAELDGGAVKGPDSIEHKLDAELGRLGPKASITSIPSSIAAYDYPPATFFIDEAHTASKPAQKKLRTLFDPASRTASLGDRVLTMKSVTFVLATSEPWGIDLDIRNRCRELELRALSISEVAEILEHDFPAWPRVLRERIAKASRLNTRKAIELSRDLARDASEAGLDPQAPDARLDTLFDALIRRLGIGYRGLKRQDADYLEVLSRLGRPVGSATLRILLPYGTYSDAPIHEVEEYLTRIGAIELRRAGRIITPEGRACLLEWVSLMSGALDESRGSE